MWKLLIVEDEPGIYNLLDNLIEYDDLGLELVGYAENGQSALDCIAIHQPDIVITDIAMPLLNGLDLIESTRQKGYSIRFIIISGYAQFDFARSAIKLGVEDYLMKPINGQELNNVLARVIDRLQQERSSVGSEVTRLQDNYRRKKLRSSFLMNCVYGQNIPDDSLLESINHEYLFSFQPGLFCFAVLQTDYAQETPLGMQNYISEHIGTLLEDAIQRKSEESEVAIHHNRLFLLINYGFPQQEAVHRALQDGLNAALEFISDYPGVTTTLGVGTIASGISQLPNSLQSAVKVLDARILLGRGLILQAEKHIGSKPDESHFSIPREFMTRVESAADCKNLKEIEPLLTEIFTDMLNACAPHPVCVFDNARDALFMILSVFKQKECFADELIPLYQKFCDEILRCFAPEDFTRRLPHQLAEFLLQSQNSDSSENTKSIEIALAYIEKNYNKNIRLEDVAEQVYLAPAYLGILFKKEVGENFSTYLTNLRIAKTKELLKDIRLNISEIAYMVGYNNKRYFSRVFKENVGISPKEYQKIHARSAY